LHGGLERRLNRDDFLHFLKYQELYLIVRHLPDLKYIGAPLKTANDQLAYAFSFPNEMWAQILQEVRRYLRLTQPSALLSEAIDGDWLTPAAGAFLAHIVDAGDSNAVGSSFAGD
jgi:hypothetical protein